MVKEPRGPKNGRDTKIHMRHSPWDFFLPPESCSGGGWIVVRRHWPTEVVNPEVVGFETVDTDLSQTSPWNRNCGFRHPKIITTQPHLT